MKKLKNVFNSPRNKEKELEQEKYENLEKELKT